MNDNVFAHVDISHAALVAAVGATQIHDPPAVYQGWEPLFLLSVVGPCACGDGLERARCWMMPLTYMADLYAYIQSMAERAGELPALLARADQTRRAIGDSPNAGKTGYHVVRPPNSDGSELYLADPETGQP